MTEPGRIHRWTAVYLDAEGNERERLSIPECTEPEACGKAAEDPRYAKYNDFKVVPDPL